MFTEGTERRAVPVAGKRGEQRWQNCEGVSVSLSWLFVTAECVGAAVESERGRERMRGH